MDSDRLKALTDGIFAVIITIMVLEMKPPDGADLASLREVAPVFLSYVLSFVYVAIYWNNHHHFFQLVPRVTGAILWANFVLLFCVSLIPFTTAWTGQHLLAPMPTALYGASLVACGASWRVMQKTIVRSQGPESPLKRAIGSDGKGLLSVLVYLAGVGLAFVAPLASYACYLVVALVWFVPDRRMEAALVGA